MVFTGPAPLDDKVVAFGVTKSAQLAAERIDNRPRSHLIAPGEKADPVTSRRRLLRLGGERRGEETPWEQS